MLAIRFVKRGVRVLASPIHAVEIQPLIAVVGDRGGVHEVRWQRKTVQRHVVVEKLAEVRKERRHIVRIVVRGIP
jgi:hypothetical protein